LARGPGKKDRAMTNLNATAAGRNSPDITDSVYAELAPEIAAKLRAQAQSIRACMAKTVDNVIDIGNVLLAVKDALEHGQFRRWVAAEIRISPATSSRWMAMASLAKCFSLKHLSLDAAYLLTAKDATPEIVAAVTTRAAGGEIMSAKMVQEMIADARRERLEAEWQARRAEKLRKMPRRKREEPAAARKDKARRAAAELIERFGREGVRFILEKIVAHRFELETAIEAALEASTPDDGLDIPDYLRRSAS
jgi:hypothetical protein